MFIHNRFNNSKPSSVDLKSTSSLLLSLFILISINGCGSRIASFTPTESDFSFIAIGDTGKKGEILENNGAVLDKMYRQDEFDALVLLGDNFYPTGLNLRKKEVDHKINSVLAPLKNLMQNLGRENVHAIAGNHDYYSRLAVKKRLLFGIVDIAVGPYGITDRGNEREAEIDLWKYYYHLPSDTVYGPADNKIQMIFIDSSLPLRMDYDRWTPALNHLTKILRSRANDPAVKWRLIFAHHPFYSIGPHGGYNSWNDETMTVDYLNPCSRDSNAISYVQNLLDPEDICAEKYQVYIDSVQAVIKRSGVKVHSFIAGHEHNLQLLYYPEKDQDCQGCPKVHIVSGAGSKINRVKSAQKNEYTWPVNTEAIEGKSKYGFVRFDLKKDVLTVRFYNGENGQILESQGQSQFKISLDGKLKF